jgi:act minimal PKS acyl carrier protein
MTDLTLDDLLGILRSSGGEIDPAYAGADVLDVPLTDLGYDSLAVLDAIGRVRRQVGVPLSDEVAGELHTPRAVLDYVHGQLSTEA